MILHFYASVAESLALFNLTNCCLHFIILQDTRGLLRLDSCRTACYNATVDRHGECYFGVGDMDITDYITPKLVGEIPHADLPITGRELGVIHLRVNPIQP